ncbi:large ribosomal subunit protein eL28y-like [Cornus florida]|uniref:large ribosomal subunit protein eL28y-like n=1 Tax=Cornus florida TaxID=4283 RepID=UPI0028A11C99|nr:large ribosomal subunit protein eL28y-like [Cornus florida]
MGRPVFSQARRAIGLANHKTVMIQPGGNDSSVLHKSVMMKEFGWMAKDVANQVADNSYRHDLKNAALASQMKGLHNVRYCLLQ